MDALGKGWFSELSPLWPGQCMSLEVEEVLYNQRSEYQHVVVFRRLVVLLATPSWRRLLLLPAGCTGGALSCH